MTYIGDNAFWGIAMRQIPPKTRYLGENYTIFPDSLSNNEIDIPDYLTRLKKDMLYVWGNGIEIYFPAGMEEIEDGSIRGDMPDICHVKSGGKATTHRYLKEFSPGTPHWIMSMDGKILYFTDLLVHDHPDYKWYKLSLFKNRSKEGDQRFHVTEDDELIIKIPEGIEEIRSGVDLHHASQIILPKSLKKISVDALFLGKWDEVKIQGDVPEFYGDLSPYRNVDGNLDILGEIKVRKGQKRKLIEQLMKGSASGGASIEEREKRLANHITTF